MLHVSGAVMEMMTAAMPRMKVPPFVSRSIVPRTHASGVTTLSVSQDGASVIRWTTVETAVTKTTMNYVCLLINILLPHI